MKKLFILLLMGLPLVGCNKSEDMSSPPATNSTPRTNRPAPSGGAATQTPADTNTPAAK